MSKKKLTPWFGDDTKPYRAGYYETNWLQGLSEPRIRYWDGACWCLHRHMESCGLQRFFWRGLARAPK